jgi:outer membrane murein-binding lipoprotein Lpp
MKSSIRIALFVIVFSALVLAGCGASAATRTTSENIPAAPAATAALDLYAAPAQEAPAQPEAQKSATDRSSVSGSAANTLPENATVQTGPESLTGAQTERMIIKNAEIKLLVEKTDTAIDRSMQVVGDVGGYIISSRVWYQEANGENYKYASITIGVPVDQFETAMRRLRGVALRVLDENASGQDVTSEYVDLQSQLGNLEATRDRIRTFLEDAKTVEESLRINQELTNIEAQIEQVKGRMNFLSNRSAYSTITVNLEPDIPPVVPTATPTAIPTATPEPWNPGKTMHQATGAVTTIYQSLFELAIWVIIVVIPLLAPPALVLWGIYKFATRKSKKTETNK